MLMFMNILVVEDTREIADSLKSSLKKEGFVVDMAFDGADGLYKASVNEYDLIVLDIGLPHKNGKEVCRELRSMGKDTPIIMLSVQGEVETKVDLLNIGADDFITKPFFFKELLARIRALLRRPRKIENTVIQIGDVIIDTDSRIVRRGEREIRLTLKEFLLLEYLVRNRGRVLPRMEILEHVWDLDADPFTNTIETHIMNIRKKVGGIGGNREEGLIRTVPGVGYKME